MKSFLIQNKILFIFGGICLLVFIIFVSLFTISDKTSPDQPSISAKPVTYPLGSNQPAEGRDFQNVTPENEIRFQQDAAVSTFIKSLPYKGEFVRVDYSYDDNSFTIRKDPDKLTQADAELNRLFDQYRIKEAIKAYTIK